MAAPNKTKETRTIVPGIWQDIMRTYDNLPAARLLTTALTQNEIAIIEGDFYRTWRVITIPSNSSSYAKFTGIPLGATFGLVSREISPSIAGVWYRVRRNATGIVTTGAPWETFNENGLSNNVSQATFEDVVSVADDGDIADIAYNPTTQTGQKIVGSLGRDSGFKIIPNDAELLLEFENLNNLANEILVYFQWIEAPQEVTG